MKNVNNEMTATQYEIASYMGRIEQGYNAVFDALDGADGQHRKANELSKEFDEKFDGVEWDAFGIGSFYQEIDKFVHKSFNPNNFTTSQTIIVEEFLKNLVSLQEIKEGRNLLSVNEVSWLNDTYDQIMVSLGNVPDGDRQREFYDKGEFLTFEQCLIEISVRIKNSDLI